MKSVVGMIVVFIGLYIIAYSDIMGFLRKNSSIIPHWAAFALLWQWLPLFWVRLLPNRYLRDEVTTMIKLLTSIKRFLPQRDNKRLYIQVQPTALYGRLFF